MALKGRIVGSLKRRMQTHLARWGMKNWEHFWKLRCQKSARRCGAKHISKSKVLKTDGLGPLLDVQMSFHMADARDCAPCHKWARREGFVEVSTTTATTRHSTPQHYTTTTTTTTTATTLHYITLIALHYTPLHYNYNHNHITLHYANSITLHYTNYTLHYTPLHFTILH